MQKKCEKRSQHDASVNGTPTGMAAAVTQAVTSESEEVTPNLVAPIDPGRVINQVECPPKEMPPSALSTSMSRILTIQNCPIPILTKCSQGSNSNLCSDSESDSELSLQHSFVLWYNFMIH